jgi:hypothetical protein
VEERLHTVALGVDDRLLAGHGERQQVVVPQHVDDQAGEPVGAEAVEVAREQLPPLAQIRQPG